MRHLALASQAQRHYRPTKAIQPSRTTRPDILARQHAGRLKLKFM